MSGQTVFESPVTINSDVCRAGDAKKLLPRTTTYPRLSDAFRNVVTRNEVEDLVRRALSPDAELVDYHLRPYSEEKIGYLGSHLCLVTATRQPGREELQKRSFFVKTVPYDVPSQVAYIEEKGCFKKEAAFAESLLPLLTRNYRGVPWTPKCYLVKKDTLVFEDMKFKGFSNRPRLFDVKTTKAAATCIARFHASSLLAEEQSKGASLTDVCPVILEESEFVRTGRSYEWYSNAMDFAVWLANDLGLDSSCIRRAGELVFDMCRPSANKTNVLSHGDLWSSNFMFDESDQCNLIDFQLMRYAPLAHDLMQFLHLCTTRDLRRRHERDIIQHYYAVLNDNLAVSRYSGPVPSYEELLQGVEEQRLPALVTAIIFHPTVFMDGKIAASIMNDPDTYEAYYFRDRVPFVRDIMTRDRAYKENIEETLRELVELSLKVDGLPRPS